MKPTTAGVAVVSGAGSGIGREVALALAQRGHRLALLGRREAPLAAVLAGVAQSGLALEVDVREAASVAAAVARIERELGPIEVLVPAAGLARVAPFTELPVEDFVDTVATNLFGAANLFRPCLEAMVARRRGHLLPILSVASRKGFPSWTAYCASKWGLAGLVEALREELRGTGVRITAIVPGATDSPIWESVPGDWPRAKMIPPAEVARAVVWALDAGDRVEVEEIRLRPPGGDL
jgi:NADP-dependent 3-hydroxy acid dehydrogenase YdfG